MRQLYVYKYMNTFILCVNHMYTRRCVYHMWTHTYIHICICHIVCCSVLQCVCCSVLQCVAVRIPYVNTHIHTYIYTPYHDRCWQLRRCAQQIWTHTYIYICIYIHLITIAAGSYDVAHRIHDAIWREMNACPTLCVCAIGVHVQIYEYIHTMCQLYVYRYIFLSFSFFLALSLCIYIYIRRGYTMLQGANWLPAQLYVCMSCVYMCICMCISPHEYMSAQPCVCMSSVCMCMSMCISTHIYIYVCEYLPHTCANAMSASMSYFYISICPQKYTYVYKCTPHSVRMPFVCMCTRKRVSKCTYIYMYVHVHIYIDVYIYVCIHILRLVQEYVCMQLYVFIYWQLYVFIYWFIYWYICIHILRFVQEYVCIQFFVCVRLLIFACVCVCV